MQIRIKFFKILIKRKFSIFEIRKNLIFRKYTGDTSKYIQSHNNFKFTIINDIEKFNKFKEKYDFSVFSTDKILSHLKNDCEVIIITQDFKVVHIRYIAFNIKSKNYIEPRFPVDFKNEATFGGGFTLLNYRRQGISNFVISKMMQYIYKKNIKYMVYSINSKNIASQKNHAQFNNQYLGKGYVINVLFLTIVLVIY